VDVDVLVVVITVVDVLVLVTRLVVSVLVDVDVDVDVEVLVVDVVVVVHRPHVAGHFRLKYELSQTLYLPSTLYLAAESRHTCGSYAPGELPSTQPSDPSSHDFASSHVLWP